MLCARPSKMFFGRKVTPVNSKNYINVLGGVGRRGVRGEGGEFDGML